MAWFQNLSIRSKVMTAFASILVITAVLGVFAINRLSVVNDAAVNLSGNYLVAADALGDVNFNGMRYRQLQAAHLLGLTKEAKAKEAETMTATAGELTKAWDIYAPTVDAGAESALAGKVMPAWNAYLAMNDKFVEMSNAGQTAAATTFYTGEMRTSYHAFQDALQADLDYQISAGHKESADAA